MCKKKVHYLCEGRIEKSVPRGLSKPRDAKRRSSGQIILSYPHTHDTFLFYSCKCQAKILSLQTPTMNFVGLAFSIRLYIEKILYLTTKET